jgi:hypothetical protein
VGTPPKNEVREEFHEGFAHSSVPHHTKPRDAQTLETVAEHDGIEGHNSNEV